MEALVGGETNKDVTGILFNQLDPGQRAVLKQVSKAFNEQVTKYETDAMKKENKLLQYKNKVSNFNRHRSTTEFCLGLAGGFALIGVILAAAFLPTGLCDKNLAFTVIGVVSASIGLPALLGSAGFGFKLLYDNIRLENELKDAFPGNPIKNLRLWEKSLTTALQTSNETLSDAQPSPT